MTLNDIFKKKGITLFNSKGEIRNAIDILEDMYLKLNAKEFIHIMAEIQEEEKYANIFDDARSRKYRGE